MSKQHRLFGAMISCLLAGVVLARSTTTWTGGAGSRDWFHAGNWSDGVPDLGEDVSIGLGADILLTNETAQIGMLDMTGGTLTFSNWHVRVSATNIAISGGTVTLPPAFTNSEMSNRVWFVSSGDFLLAAGAVIDVNGKGYAGGSPNEYGNGPGGGHGPCSYGSGAGHGGRGGSQGNSIDMVGGDAYGSYSAPEQPGSGGATKDAKWQAGDGGGAVRISAAGTVTLDGAIRASGVRNGIYSGGGSGGSVYVDCHTFAGSGTVNADGNTVSRGGGGGAGGRIAIVYNPAAQSSEPPFSVTFSVKGGAGAYQNLLTRDGEPGTLYFPGTPLLTETIALPHVGRLIMPGVSEWKLDRLSVAAACALVLPDGFEVVVTNDCRIENGALDLGWGGSCSIGGTLTLADQGLLSVRSSPTNGVDRYGAVLDVEGDIDIAGGAWLQLYCHPTNGGAPAVFCRNVTIATADAGIRADYGGFKGGDAGVSQDGYGPGGGFGGTYGGGAAHGGQGGWGSAAYGWSFAYGCATNVALPGSGGGSYSYGNGGEGGGLVRLVASGDVVVNGAISADGHAGWYYSGGGSGGGVDVSCRTLTGTGTIRARGGDGSGNGGGGGGGRIAIHYDEAAQNVASPVDIAFHAGGGAGSARQDGDKGTLCFPPLLRENLDREHAGKLILPEQPSWFPEFITVSAACDLELPDDFRVEVADDVMVNSGQFGFGMGSDVLVGGNVTLTNGGRMVLRSGPTNTVNPDHGARLDVSGDLTIRADSWLYPVSHPINGGGPSIRVRNLFVADPESGIDADSRGFLGGNYEGYGNDGSDGLGYGRGRQIGYGGGGGHGGAGGDCSRSTESGGAVYGYTNAPGAGSGGGEGASSGQGGQGGGQIRVEATETILVNGIVTANGGTAGYYAGGGSGGGIWLIARQFAGDGTLRANGGNSNNQGGSGGGGRIALWGGRPLSAGNASEACPGPAGGIRGHARCLRRL